MLIQANGAEPFIFVGRIGAWSGISCLKSIDIKHIAQSK